MFIKQFLYLILSFSTLFTCQVYASENLVAKNYQLEDGVYSTNLNFCNYRITNDVFKNSIIVTGVSDNSRPCDDTQELREAERTSSREFTFYDHAGENTLTEDKIKKCTPSSDNIKPCYEYLYGTDGELLVRKGDYIISVLILKMLNPDAFKMLRYNYAMRGTQILAKREIKPEVLYAKKAVCSKN